MPGQREVRIAVAADLHFDGTHGVLRDFFADVRREADVLALCGDLTSHGEEVQIRGFVEEMEGLDIPIVAVLGNHDYEGGQHETLCQLLQEQGVHVLDGDNVVVEGVGFAGVKGFGGGFDRHALGPFGERIYKDFVQAAIEESLKLETALRTLDAEVRIALLHYAPISGTLAGEPPQIFPFLGSSRLLPPIDTYAPDAVFHGHAHIGAPEARTPSGVPVYNVAMSLLEQHTGRPFRLWTARAPDRRRGRGDGAAAPPDGGDAPDAAAAEPHGAERRDGS